MRLWSRTFLLGIAATLMMASGAAAITIHDVVRTDFNPGADDVLLSYGSGGRYITYDPIEGSGLFNSTTGAPGATGTWAGNPGWLDFLFNSGGALPGGGTGPLGPGTNQVSSSYTLSTHPSAPSSFDFSVLFYNPNYDASVVDGTTNVAQVILAGSDGTAFAGTAGTGDNEALVTAAELRAGIMLTWSISADAGVDLNVVINSLGVGAYAAGFFLDKVTPEPATLGLLAIGLGGLILRRRGR